MTDRELLEAFSKAAALVDYYPETGSMKWRKRDDGSDAARWNTRYAGRECGVIDDKGYRRIEFKLVASKKLKIRAHRIAWFIAYGSMPKADIDHINQDRSDNRLENLRDVPKNINLRNCKKRCNNTSGAAGVIWHKQRGKWCAQAFMDGKHYHLGLFEELTAAETAARKFRLLNGFTEAHGRVKQ